MKRRVVISTLGLAALVPLILQSGAPVRQARLPARTPGAAVAAQTVSPAAKMSLVEGYSKLSVNFEANLGQTDKRVKFLSRGRGYSLFLTPTETVLALRRPRHTRQQISQQFERTGSSEGWRDDVLRLKLAGANTAPEMVGEGELPGKSNYFLGNDPKKWRTNVPHFARVRMKGVYPGVDLVFYGDQQQLEYDLVVAPGTAPSVIRLAFEGVEKLGLDPQGNLILDIPGGQVVQQAPLIYQELESGRRTVAGHYLLSGAKEVSFSVAEYDSSRALVIDPILVYSTYLGGSAYDEGRDIAADAPGNVYITGNTYSLDFPVANALQSATEVTSEIFVSKLDPTGSVLIFSTYLGGSLNEMWSKIALGADGNLYVAGLTASPDFPMVNPFRASCGQDLEPPLCFDIFVAKLSPEGDRILFSTFMNAPGQIEDVAVDPEGNVYLTGFTRSRLFPAVRAVQNSFSGGWSDAFAMKLNAAGTALVYSTYLGGSNNDDGLGIAADTQGNTFIVGNTQSVNFPVIRSTAFQPDFGGNVDLYLVQLDPNGFWVFSTFLGGTHVDGTGGGIAVDSAGSVYVTGTVSPGFPTTPGALRRVDCCTICNSTFVARFLQGGHLVYLATFAGGPSRGIAVDQEGNAYIGGQVFPQCEMQTVDPLQSRISGGAVDAFVAKVNPVGSALLYSTYLGGGSVDFISAVATDGAGSAYVIGGTDSTDFPTANALQPALANSGTELVYREVFLAKIASGDNTPAGGDVQVSPVDGITITFTNVQTPGTTSFTRTDTGPALPSGFSLGDPATYYEVSTTAAYSGRITVCISYRGVDFILEEDLRLFHYENGAWVELPGLPDTTNKIMCGEVTSLSPFAILHPELPPLEVRGLEPPLAALVPADEEVPFSAKAFKQGRTLPLKLQIFAGDSLLGGDNVTPPRIVALSRVGEPPLNLAVVDLDAGETSDSGLEFRYSDTHWVYNLSTRHLPVGTYFVTIRAPGGARYQAAFVLK